MKTDNYIKVILTSIVILLGIIVVKDIDLPPKAHANFLGNNQKYQISCGEGIGDCLLLNIQTGISKVLYLGNMKDMKDKLEEERRTDLIGKFALIGEKPDF